MPNPEKERHSMHRNTALIVLALGALPLSAIAGEDHTHEGDVVLTVRHGRIITGSGEGPDFRRAQVFGSELGAEGFPNTTDEPGFDNLPGTFSPGSLITFNVLSELLQWDGPGLGSTVNGEVMEISLGPVSVTSSTGFVPGFALPVEDSGEWHEHYEYTLIDGGRGVTDGVYILKMNLVSDDASLGRSVPFWLVFNQNADEAIHDGVIEWVEANVVPTPGAIALLIPAILGAARRRR